MDLTVNEYIDGLLSEEGQTRPCDHGKEDELELKMKLPPWYDEEKYNQGRRVFWDFCFPFFVNMVLGLVALLSVPSILNILVGTRRSNSIFTSYRRYISTLMHVISWHNHDLKPGTKAWRSLKTVRTRHLQASIAASKKGQGTVSQRDMALTQFAFIGFAILKPDKLSIRQIKSGDWESYNHFWRTIGYLLGMEDRYNLCRKNVDETREACRLLQDRVFTPCLENVPEYFEHTAHVMLKAMGIVTGLIEPSMSLFAAKNMADVPGYVYIEGERIAFQNKLKDHLRGRSEDIGIDTAVLIPKCAVVGLPKLPPRLLYIRDFDTIETTPAYMKLTFRGKYCLAVADIMIALYAYNIFRFIMNLTYRFIIFTIFYFPLKTFMVFGFRNSFVNMFEEDPKDDAQLKPNSEYQKPPPPETWYSKLYAILW